MGEVQEQRFVCRICSKICVSGKSLGGHMRVHLAQISASKKAAAAAAQEIKLECDDDDVVDDNEEDGGSYHQSNSEEKMKDEFEDADQSNSYELRENPKKSWRISDPKHGLHKKHNSCKECGKEFASLRALSGHMRCHSIKNKKEVHPCKECGREFDSMRAMFGHMKSHSKKLKVESAESLSDLENFCPIRRKRSRIRYKGAVNFSFSGLDVSDCGVSELEEAEEAAKCLVMLSRGVRSCLKVESNADSSEDDSAYFGAVTSSVRSKKFCGNDNVSRFDEFGLEFDHTKFDLDPDQASDDKFLELAIGNNRGDESGFQKICGDDLEMMNDFTKKKPKYKQSGLGIENGRHKMVGTDLLSVNKADFKLDPCGAEDDQLAADEQETGSVVPLSLLQTGKRKGRECPICFKVFTSGQALGGHKRAHYNGVVESKNGEAAEAQGMLDLNFPISGDAGTMSSLGFNSWLVERRLDHEALVLTI